MRRTLGALVIAVALPAAFATSHAAAVSGDTTVESLYGEAPGPGCFYSDQYYDIRCVVDVP